jgi:hypothetical protein
LSERAPRTSVGISALLVCAAAATASGVAVAEEPARSTLSCRHEAGSGRLLCNVSVTARAGEEIVWSDALVVATPSALRALRSRVASKSDEPARVVLAFVIGSGAGGRIAVRSRAVTCPARPRRGACTPVTSEVGYDFEPPAE